MAAMQNTDSAATSRSSLRIAGRGGFFRSLALTASILGSLVAQATETPQPLSLRNSNPLLQTLGAPAMKGGELAPAGALEYRWTLNMANHADSGLDDGEEAVFDGESYYLALELRYGVNPRLELGMDRADRPECETGLRRRLLRQPSGRTRKLDPDQLRRKLPLRPARPATIDRPDRKPVLRFDAGFRPLLRIDEWQTDAWKPDKIISATLA